LAVKEEPLSLPNILTALTKKTEKNLQPHIKYKNLSLYLFRFENSFNYLKEKRDSF